MKWDSLTSQSFTVTNGVRQGSIISPHLFAVYVDDLSSSLINSSHGCRINDVIIHLFYSDYLCLMAPSPAALQVLINICSQFSEDKDLTFNPNKSMLNCPSVYIDNTELSYVYTAKYLGVFISHDLRDDTDMKRQFRSLYISANTMIRKFTKCSLEAKLALCKSYCTSTYCSHLWVNYSKVTFSKLRVAYNNVYMYLLK